jgi:hypothetical protein
MKYFDLERMGLPNQSFVFGLEKGFVHCKLGREAECYRLAQSRTKSKDKI